MGQNRLLHHSACVFYRTIAMIEFVKKVLANQFEASLCMMNDCLHKCPPEHWDGGYNQNLCMTA